ncbi:MAG: hypothetical protein ACM3RP_10185 [Chitinophagales bacterium]
MTLHRLSRHVMAIVLVVFLVGAISILTTAPAYAAVGDIPPAVPAIDPTTLVVALTMATVEALKRYAKLPTDLVWLPVILLGIAVNVGYAVLFTGATGAAITEAAKTGLWLGIVVSGLFSLGRASLSRQTEPPAPASAPTPTPTE